MIKIQMYGRNEKNPSKSSLKQDFNWSRVQTLTHPQQSKKTPNYDLSFGDEICNRFSLLI